jgi:hypothetical protein
MQIQLLDVSLSLKILIPMMMVQLKPKHVENV